MSQILEVSDRDALQYQLLSSGVPLQYLDVLVNKLETGTFDAHTAFELLQVEYDDDEGGRQPHEPTFVLQAIRGIDPEDPQHVYLIDHFWTFRIADAKATIKANPQLRTRLSKMLDLEYDYDDDVDDGKVEKDPNKQVDEIFENMWRLCNHYTIPNFENIEDRLPIWYIMDEVGCGVTHSHTEPNCRIVPLFYNKQQLTFSILYPIKSIRNLDVITRDFSDGLPEGSDLRRAFLLPYTNEAFDVGFKAALPGADYYLAGHIQESLPNIRNYSPVIKTNYKVFTEYELIKRYLTDNRYEFVDNEQEADILWYTKHFKDYERLSETPQKFINQFPYEFVLTIKDLLCLTCKKSQNCNEFGYPNWLPITYNLKTEIPNFFAYFNYCKTTNDDNLWIIKPFNLARSLDTNITDNLVLITKLLTTGPKIAQKYITKPVLFQRPDLNCRVKFDVRYVIVVKNIKPLDVFVYRNFFLRFANKPFQLDNFDDYQSHFTVMNYQTNTQLFHLKCNEFKEHWLQQYPNYQWDCIEKSIFDMLKEILECATKDGPPCGIAESPQSRAIYAADILLEWKRSNDDDRIQPLILEINFIPDCQRACDYYEDFYNQIFNLFFFNEQSDCFVKL